MAAELILAPEAARDLEEAADWYENQRPGLGEELLRCVEACIQAVCRTPEMHAKVHEDYRRSLVRRFPYAIIYECKDNVVTIYSIFHTSQDPRKWRSRLP
jgi:plasmid stabilization system protein ParE